MSNKYYASVAYGIRLTEENAGLFSIGNVDETLGKLYPEGNPGLEIDFHEVSGGPRNHMPILVISNEAGSWCTKHNCSCLPYAITSSGDHANELTRLLTALSLHKEEWDARITQCITRFKGQEFFPFEETPQLLLYLHSDGLIK